MDNPRQGHAVDASLVFLRTLEDEMRELNGGQHDLLDGGNSNNTNTLDSQSIVGKRKRLGSSKEREASKRTRSASVVFGPAEPPHQDRSQQLPAELWHRIFSFLPPDSLGRLLRASKLFHKYLDPTSSFIISTPVIHAPTPRIWPTLSPDAIWRRSRIRYWPNMPAPLKGKFELDMWRFVCTRFCQLCGLPDKAYAVDDSLRGGGLGNTAVSPIFPFFINSCGDCLVQISVKEIDLHLSRSNALFISPGLPMVFLTSDGNVISPVALQNDPSVTVKLTRVYWPVQVDSLQAEFEEVKQLGAATVEEWIKGLDRRGTEAIHDASRWDKWLQSGGVRQMRTTSTQSTPANSKVERMQAKASGISQTLQKPRQDIETVVRMHISNLADEVIRDCWVKGHSVKKENCEDFTAEVLAYVRSQFYKVGANAASLTRRLNLDDMRWVFDNKIKFHTDRHKTDFLRCRECPNAKRYGITAILQHYAMKHCSKQMEPMSMLWKAEWPEEPPFGHPSAGQKVAVGSTPHRPQGVEYVDPMRTRVNTMAQIMKPAWNTLIKAKHVPTSVRISALIHRIAKGYQDQYREPMPLQVFLDGLHHHESFNAISKSKGLACQACMSLRKQNREEVKMFSLLGLAHHFHDVHEKEGMSPAGWSVNMVWVPNIQGEGFLKAMRTSTAVFHLLSDALPWLFDQNGRVSPKRQQSHIATDWEAADGALEPNTYHYSDESSVYARSYVPNEQSIQRVNNFREPSIEIFERYDTPSRMRAQYTLREPSDWSDTSRRPIRLGPRVDPRLVLPEPRRDLETYYLRRRHAPHMIEEALYSERERRRAEVERRYTSPAYTSGYRQPTPSVAFYRPYDIGIVDVRGFSNDHYIQHPNDFHDYRNPYSASDYNFARRELHNYSTPALRVYPAYDSRDALTDRRSSQLE